MAVSESEEALSTTAGAAKARVTMPERMAVVLMMEAVLGEWSPLDECVDEDG